MNIVSWRSPSNIALVKYWGKKEIQIPLNPSISFTLEASHTETQISYSKSAAGSAPEISFRFEGLENPPFEARVRNFIVGITKYLPVLQGLKLDIESRNSFPHSSGIASSASAMSALALCLITIEKNINGSLHFISDFYQKASFIARLGSGSAARSVYGGVNLWGQTKDMPAATNDYALEITGSCHPIFASYHDAILLVSHQEKKVLSSAGHGLMKDNPYAPEKFKQGLQHTHRLLHILKSGDQMAFAELVEAEALALHAMMMTSRPSYLLMEPHTLEIINRIRKFRTSKNIPVCFTLDAGANVHFLYPGANKTQVQDFIETELLEYCYHGKWIADRVGKGPVELINTFQAS